MITSESVDDFYAVEFENKFTLLPGPEFNPRLYRGQTKFHEQCFPTLYRKMDQLSIFVKILKNYEFYKFLLGSHPIIKELRQWVFDGKHFHIDLEGLAQHYGFSTTFIDVTRSKDVALFFAYCKLKNSLTNEYEPILDTNHYSVLYTIDFSRLYKHDTNFFNPIGFQGLPRPEEQKACSIPLFFGNDFNKLPHINYEYLKITPTESNKYYEMFEGGKALFPTEPTSNIAHEIKESKTIDIDVLENTFNLNLIPKYFTTINDAKKFLEANKYSVQEKNIKISSETRETIIKNWQQKLPTVLNKIKARFASDSTKDNKT
ncbi:FRG domain-containing protein [Solidesulfovibrio sp. C21]|uniref:FRG domain-containing protein n=1 Tax=Solidesulfovibrio sp. C21 TaxID=3398613 RepID=UPI0039FBFBF8